MRTSDSVGCTGFPCADINPEGYRIPDVNIDPDRVSIILISEAAPPDPADGYYANGLPQAGSLFEQTTVLAFQDASADVSSLQDLLDLGVYFTTGIKCAKTGYTVKAGTVTACATLLQRELAPFHHVKAYLLMGDVAIKALNAVAKLSGKPRVIPAGATYKIRGHEYYFRGARAFPSYLQAGPSFFIEKSKRTMIAEDIASALALLR